LTTEIQTITEGFLKSAGGRPQDILFHFFSGRWETLTYGSFLREVRAIAAGLVRLGMKKYDRVAIVSENRPEWGAAYLAITMGGGIAVPIDPQLGAGEIFTLARHAGAGIIFHSAGTSAALTSAAEGHDDDAFLLLDFDSPAYTSLKENGALDFFQEVKAENVASIIYTSGTTGAPKGVELTHGNFCSDAEALISAGIVNHEDNVLSVLPLHHTYAFMCTFLVPVFLGASITYPASIKGPELVAAVRERGVSVVIAVPQLLGIIRNNIMSKIKGLPRPLPSVLTTLHRLSGLLRTASGLNPGRHIFRSVHETFGKRLRFFGSGGARLDPAVMKDLEAFGFTVLEGYGLTETSPVVTFNPPKKRRPGSAGRPLPSVRIRILSPSSETGEGEIAIKGPMVMKGYYRNPAATAQVISDGWFRTGDIGILDKEGYLYVTGRSKEVIVLSSGKNIYPEEVEKLYEAAPAVKEVCILGLAKEGKGESLHAVVVPDMEHVIRNRITDVREAVKWQINEISGKIPSYMRVTGFTIRTEPLPRTPLGKLKRFLVMDSLTGEETQERPEGQGRGEPEDEIGRKLLSLLREAAGGRQEIGMDDNLDLDIGLDSLSKVELAASLEEAFSLRLPEDFLAGIQTVTELKDAISLHVSSGRPAMAVPGAGLGNILSREPSENDLRMVSLKRPESKMTGVWFAHTFLKLLFRTCFRLEARGIDNVPDGANFIISPNHTSYLDGFAVILSLPFSSFRNIYSLGLSDFFAGFLKSRFARVAHVIPIDSSSYLSKALQMSAYVLRNGRSLCVFPEGGRSRDGSVLEFKKGVGVLAVEMGVPVVPVFIRGAFEALPPGAFLPRCRKITVTFGKPLIAGDLDFPRKDDGVDEYQLFANELRERVIRLNQERP